LYGYRHTPYDELVSLSAGATAVALVVLVLYRAARNTAGIVVDSIGDMVFMTDRRGRIVYANAAFATLHGFESTYDVIGKPAEDFWVAKKHREIYRDELQRLGSVSNYLLYSKRRDRAFCMSLNSRHKPSSVGHESWGTGRDVTNAVDVSGAHYQVNAGPAGDHKDAELTFCNQQFASLFGYDGPEELIGRKVDWLYVNGHNRDTIVKRLKESKDHVGTFLLSLSRKDGKSLVVESRKTLLIQGSIDTGIEGIIRNVSAEWDESLAGVFVIQDGFLKYVNRSLAQALGYPMDELMGLSALRIFESGDLAAMSACSLDAGPCRLGASPQPVVKARRKDGITISALVISACCDFNGHPATRGQLIDVTQLTEVLTKERIAHYTALLVSGLIHNKLRKAVGKIRNEANDLAYKGLEVVRPLATAADDALKRIDEVETALTTPVSPSSVASLVHAAVAAEKQSREFEYSVVEDDSVPRGMVIENPLIWVFCELIRNAHESRPSGLVLSVGVRHIAEGQPIPGTTEVAECSHVIAEFSDNASGVSDGLRKALFEPHVTTKDDPHAGLGLAVNRGILEHFMKGRLVLISTSSSGSRFGVVIPAERGEQTEDDNG